MKKMFSFFIAALLLPISVFAIEYKAGVHYQVLEAPASAKPEVREFFSYYCPHCYKFEPIIQSLKQGLNTGVKFEKTHVSFLPQRQPKAAELLTKALIAAQLLKIETAISNRIFQAIHVKGKKLLTEKDVQTFFLAEGVDEKKFKGAFNNFMVASQVQQMRAKQDAAKITGVPSIIVNGKYKATPNKDIKDTADYIKLVNYLTTLK